MSPIHHRISSVRSLFEVFVETVPQGTALREEVSRLQEQLGYLLKLPATAGLRDQWSVWCERFEKLPDDSYEKQLLELYIAMPN
jgi:hypothetical protein